MPHVHRARVDLLVYLRLSDTGVGTQSERDARVVMEVLGHSQISLTMNPYSHVLPALQVEAASRLDSLLADGAPLVEAAPLGWRGVAVGTLCGGPGMLGRQIGRQEPAGGARRLVGGPGLN
jgi:hypothetical protein